MLEFQAHQAAPIQEGLALRQLPEKQVLISLSLTFFFPYTHTHTHTRTPLINHTVTFYDNQSDDTINPN